MNAEMTKSTITTAPVKGLQAPLVHLNGTSAKELMMDLHNAYEIVGDAFNALTGCGPNGRDFYPLGADAMASAEREHRERMKSLEHVQDELQSLIACIQEQDEARAR